MTENQGISTCEGNRERRGRSDDATATAEAAPPADSADAGTEAEETEAEETEAPGTETPEIGGPKGPEPTRYGDWERKGRCTDF